MRYPSGRVVEWAYDEAGRTASVTGLKDGAPASYLTGITYAPHGGMASSQIAGARTTQQCYNQRMQPVAIRVGASPSANCDWVTGDLLRIGLGYGPSGTLNNGNILTQLIQVPGARGAKRIALGSAHVRGYAGAVWRRVVAADLRL